MEGPFAQYCTGTCMRWRLEVHTLPTGFEAPPLVADLGPVKKLGVAKPRKQKEQPAIDSATCSSAAAVVNSEEVSSCEKGQQWQLAQELVSSMGQLVLLADAISCAAEAG
eukprot:Skav209669  [mRNA]  locus=scaffold2126:285591:289610:+ [translate_table: standard]